jgi:tetratricopeptide (TPR) repeat protein
MNDPFLSLLTGREFEKLVTAVRLAHNGLFLIALYHNATSRRVLVTELHRRLAPLPLYEYAISPQSPGLAAFVRQLPAKVQAERAIVSVHDLEVEWPVSAQRLDRQRDQLAAYPFTYIVWIQARLWGQLASEAPNFFSRHSGVFDLRLPQTPETIPVPGVRPMPDDEAGLTYESLAEWQALVDLYTSLLAEHEAVYEGDLKVRVDLHGRLAWLYQARSDFQHARDHYQKAFALLSDEADPQQKAEMLYCIGRMHCYAGEHETAFSLLQQALAQFRALESRSGEANTLLALGDAARQLAKWSEAWDYYEQARQLYEATKDRYSLARVLYRQGDWLAAQDKPAEAIERYDRAVALWRSGHMDSLVEQILLPRRQQAVDSMQMAAQ